MGTDGFTGKTYLSQCLGQGSDLCLLWQGSGYASDLGCFIFKARPPLSLVEESLVNSLMLVVEQEVLVAVFNICRYMNIITTVLSISYFAPLLLALHVGAILAFEDCCRILRRM